MKTNKELELLYVETDLFTLILKGRPVHPAIESLHPHHDEARALLEVNPIGCSLLQCKHFDPKEGSIPYGKQYVYPFLYEQQSYQLLIKGRPGVEVAFFHENQRIRESITAVGGDRSLLMGAMNFYNDVGYSELEVRREDRPLLIIKLEIFPSKIDYRMDYYNLLQEVNQEVYNLSYDFMRTTFLEMKIKEADNISHGEFFSILRGIYKHFTEAFHRIREVPHHTLVSTERVIPSSRVKKINQKSIQWINRRQKHYDEELGLPVNLLEIKKRPSFDTFENRFVKWMIKQISKRIGVFLFRYHRLYQESVEERVCQEAQSMSQQLSSMVSQTFLADVGEIHQLASLSLVLQMAPGYRDLYKYFLLLSKGLTINGELCNLSMKEIWKIYEYWCFLRINRILRQKYCLIKHNLISIDYSGIYLTLVTSKKAEVKYRNPKNGEVFKLSYNSAEGELVTTAQRPDHVLTLQKEGSTTLYKFIFDAKYRINPAYPCSRYAHSYSTPGPEEDTINNMHRYRDAIVSTGKSNEYRRIIVGAYVLFPYHNEEEFSHHVFYKSIAKVNVGAFPFLPGHEELLSTFLEDLVEETPLSTFERNLLPAGSDEYQESMCFAQNVLVGNVASENHLDLFLQDQLFFLPCRRVSFLHRNLTYIALYLRKDIGRKAYGVVYYALIQRVDRIKREAIPLPCYHGNDGYYLFHVSKWQELKPPILPEGYGVCGTHLYTNEMLLLKASALPELSIKTVEEWRIWLELRRIKEELKVKVSQRDLDNSTSVSHYLLGDIRVEVRGDEIIVSYGESAIRKTYGEFISNLRGVMKELF